MTDDVIADQEVVPRRTCAQSRGCRGCPRVSGPRAAGRDCRPRWARTCWSRSTGPPHTGLSGSHSLWRLRAHSTSHLNTSLVVAAVVVHYLGVQTQGIRGVPDNKNFPVWCTSTGGVNLLIFRVREFRFWVAVSTEREFAKYRSCSRCSVDLRSPSKLLLVCSSVI